MHLVRVARIGAASLIMVFTLAIATQAQTKVPSGQTNTTVSGIHRVVIQVTQNDPAVMNMALNNAENLDSFYKDKGEKVLIELVAYGAGLNMVRSDTSPVKDRLAAIGRSMKNVTFTGCGNTLAAQSKQEQKEITLLPQARMVPTGIARIVELQENGWTYVRP